MKPPELKIINQSQKIELKISQSLLGEIWNLHKKIDGLEWSGLVFYDVEGDISDPANLKLKAMDFVLLDVGSAAYTEFKLNTNLFDIFDEKPHLMGKQYGLMHSHHKMNAFFSGTDSENLHESAAMFNFYLSLIVNISGDFVAKVSVQGKREATGVNYTKNNRGQLVSTSFTHSYECVFVYECDIIWDCSQTYKIDGLKKSKKMTSIDFGFSPREKKQLSMFDPNDITGVDADEEDLGIDLVKATFSQRCTVYIEKLTFLTLDDPGLKDELVRMADLTGDLWDEVEEDSEVLLQTLFESYTDQSVKTLKQCRTRFIQELKRLLKPLDLKQEVFSSFEILFNSAFEVYE